MKPITLALASALIPTLALAQGAGPSAPTPSPEEQRALYCLDTARQRDYLNSYAVGLQAQVAKLTSDLKEAQEQLEKIKKEESKAPPPSAAAPPSPPLPPSPSPNKGEVK